VSFLSRIFGGNPMALTVKDSAFEQRSLQAARSEIRELRSTVNRYEAAIPFSPDRSYVPGWVRDARYDADPFSRWEMSRKVRDYRRNVWLLQRLEEEFTKWTVGPNGLAVIPNSSDDKWNAAMMESYQEWCESPCLDSTLTMPQVHRLMARESHIDGELFINKTRRKEKGKPSLPAVQLIESHRCSSPGTEYSYGDHSNIIDGVELGIDSATGQPTRPIGYWVRDGIVGDSWVFRSTADMHHVFDPVRIGMFRDITPYHASLPTIGDLGDLEAMEMQKAKQNSEVANILTNPAGEINPNLARQQRWGGSGTVPNPNPNEADMDKRVNMYRRILGSRTIALKTGEKLDQHDSKTPSAATQWYWRYKIGQVCTAANIPLIIVFPELVENINGTVVRGIYDNAHEFFRSKFFVFSHAARDMYRFYAQWARYNDPRCVDAPADWKKCHVIPPRAVNVDIGYNSAATLAELEAGTTNWDDIAGRYGTTAEVLIRKKAKNIAMIKRIAKEESKDGNEVLPSEISAPIADVLQKLGMAKQAEAMAEAAGETQKKEPVEA
jgi:capsid protein